VGLRSLIGWNAAGRDPAQASAPPAPAPARRAFPAADRDQARRHHPEGRLREQASAPEWPCWCARLPRSSVPAGALWGPRCNRAAPRRCRSRRSVGPLGWVRILPRSNG